MPTLIITNHINEIDAIQSILKRQKVVFGQNQKSEYVLETNIGKAIDLLKSGKFNRVYVSATCNVGFGIHFSTQFLGSQLDELQCRGFDQRSDTTYDVIRLISKGIENPPVLLPAMNPTKTSDLQKLLTQLYDLVRDIYTPGRDAILANIRNLRTPFNIDSAKQSYAELSIAVKGYRRTPEVIEKIGTELEKLYPAIEKQPQTMTDLLIEMQERVCGWKNRVTHPAPTSTPARPAR